MFIRVMFNSPVFSLVLTASFIVLNILDGHSTYLVLKPHHYHREKNPIARWIFKKLKLPQGIIIFKTILLSVIIIAIAYYAAWDPFTINIAMMIANLLFLLVVGHNYRIFRRMHKY